jgi:hypothetical protein
MLTRFDDYPIHQTAEPLAFLETSDRNAYARYWFNGFDPDGEFYFGIAFAIYPHREVMDCALSIVRKDGTQDSFRASRRLRGDRTDMRVGPFTLQIVDPMRTVRVCIARNDTGITADLTFEARGPARDEPQDVIRHGVRTIARMTRFTQFGMWSGHITVGEKRQDVDPAKIYATRDRSWGWRGVGEPEPGVSKTLPEQMFWLWAPIHWEKQCTHYGVFESKDGKRGKEFAHIFPAYERSEQFDPVGCTGFRECGTGAHRLTFKPGGRFAGASEIDLIDAGETVTIKLQPLLTFYMMGIGYFHETWGHGFYKGEEAITAEHWNLSELDTSGFQYQHVQHVVRATRGDEVGHGVLEQLIYGPHRRYGFKAGLEPAGA